AGGNGSADDCRIWQRARSRRGALHPLPPQRISRLLGIHREPAAHRDAPQGRMIAAASVDLQSLTTGAGPLFFAVIASYLLGSIPAAYIAGKSKGIDLRKHGSGN